MTLAEPIFLAVGVALAALLVLGEWRRARRRRILADALGGPRAGARLAWANLYRPSVGRMVLLAAIALAVAAAAADPLRVVESDPPPPPVPNSIVIALDVSASMQATDEAPNRLGSAVRMAEALIGDLEGERVGLVLFAGEAYPLAPPTRDHAVLAFLLRGVTPTIASAHDPGSLLSSGIRGGAALLQAEGEPEGNRTIVVISDGEPGEPEESWREAVDEVAGLGITMHSIGVGTEAGSGMTMPTAPFQLGGTIFDPNGTPAVSHLRESTLTDVASLGRGRYAHGTDESAVRALGRTLASPPTDVLGTSDVAASLATVDPAVWLVLLALALLLVESAFDVRPFRFRRSRFDGALGPSRSRA